MNIQQRKYLIVLISIGVVVAIVWSVVYMVFAMRITKEMPHNAVIPTSSHMIRYTFSRPITHHNLKVSSVHTHTMNVTKNEVIITFNDALNAGETVDISGTVYGDTWLMPQYTVSRHYEVTYVEYANLSEEQKQEGIKATDTLPDKYPLSKKLPFVAKGFNIEYRAPSANSNKMEIIVAVTEIDPMAVSEPSDSPANLAVLRKNRDAAVAWLAQNGWDDTKYELHVAEPYLLKEYNAKIDQNSQPYTGG